MFPIKQMFTCVLQLAGWPLGIKAERERACFEFLVSADLCKISIVKSSSRINSKHTEDILDKMIWLALVILGMAACTQQAVLGSIKHPVLPLEAAVWGTYTVNRYAPAALPVAGQH